MSDTNQDAMADIGDIWRCGCGEEWIEDGEGAQGLPAECGRCGRDMVHVGPRTVPNTNQEEEDQ